MFHFSLLDFYFGYIHSFDFSLERIIREMLSPDILVYRNFLEFPKTELVDVGI